MRLPLERYDARTSAAPPEGARPRSQLPLRTPPPARLAQAGRFFFPGIRGGIVQPAAVGVKRSPVGFFSFSYRGAARSGRAGRRGPTVSRPAGPSGLRQFPV